MDYAEVIESLNKTTEEVLAEKDEQIKKEIFDLVSSKEYKQWLIHPQTIRLTNWLRTEKLNVADQSSKLAAEGMTQVAGNNMMKYFILEQITEFIYARSNIPTS